MDKNKSNYDPIERKLPLVIFGAITTKDLVKDIISLRLPSQPSKGMVLLVEFVSYGAAVSVAHFLAKSSKREPSNMSFRSGSEKNR